VAVVGGGAGAVVAGGLMWLASAVGLWWTAPISIAVLALALRGSRSAAAPGPATCSGSSLPAVLNWAGTYVGAVWLFLPVPEAAFHRPARARSPLACAAGALPVLIRRRLVLSEARRSASRSAASRGQVAFSRLTRHPAVARLPVRQCHLRVAAAGGLLALGTVWLLSAPRRAGRSGRAAVPRPARSR